LGEYPQLSAVPLLVRKLDSSDAAVRAAAIESLGNLRAAEGRVPLLKRLQDSEAMVRRAAAEAAGKLGLNEATEPLLKLMADKDARVRQASLNALRLLRDPRAVPLAEAALHERALEQTALETLKDLGRLENVDAIVDHAKRNPSAEVVAAVVRVLTTWRERAGITAALRADLDLAVAQIHGESGIPVRWQSPGPFRPLIEQRPVFGLAPLEGRVLFADGMEARVVLAPKADGANGIWFAHTDVAVDTPTSVEFLASSRGSLQVWLNGKPIYERAKSRSYETDSDRFAGKLDKGINRLLVHTSSANAAVEFQLRFRRKSSTAEHEKLTLAALSRAGNADRGRKFFFDKEKSQCMKCHQLGNLGERIGPELTGVGGRFSRIHLVESILEPSRAIAPSFGTWVFTLTSGKVFSGVKVAETETALILADNQGQKQTLMKADIEEQHLSTISSMPEGLERRFTEDEFVDLIAFLASQKDGR
jgi:putative heme-binding domain-containing protein